MRIVRKKYFKRNTLSQVSGSTTPHRICFYVMTYVTKFGSNDSIEFGSSLRGNKGPGPDLLASELRNVVALPTQEGEERSRSIPYFGRGLLKFLTTHYFFLDI
jgi:hypothetical protein